MGEPVGPHLEHASGAKDPIAEDDILTKKVGSHPGGASGIKTGNELAVAVVRQPGPAFVRAEHALGGLRPTGVRHVRVQTRPEGKTVPGSLETLSACKRPPPLLRKRPLKSGRYLSQEEWK
jgi:hypothetical protein